MKAASWRLIATLALVAALHSPAASADQLAGAGTGSVVGIVKDVTGTAMPGVEVTIAGATLTRNTRSRPDGEYHFAAVPPGDHVLTVAAPGFTSVTRDVHVGLGFTVTANITLMIAGQVEEVVVDAGLDRHAAAIAQTFDRRRLETLPSSRSVGGLFALTHALELAVAEVGGGTGIVTGGYGAYGRSNSPRHTIEGIVVTGLFGAGFTPDYGSLAQASILTAGHGAEWPTAGVHTDFVTKSGSNQYRGSVYAAAEHRRLQASNVDGDQVRRGALAGGGLRASEANQLWRNSDVNADVGGFIRRDRLWWYGSVRRQHVAARLVNFPAEPYATWLTNFTGKATYRASPRHTFVVYGQRGLNHQPHRLDPFGPGGSGLSAVTAVNATGESTVDQRNSARLWKGEWNGLVADSAVVEVRLGQFANEQDWRSRSTAPRFEDIDTLEVRGGNRDWLSRQRRDQLFGTVSQFTRNRTGNHHFRFGGDAIRFLVREKWVSGYPDNVLHVLRSGRPASVFLFDAPSLSEAGFWTYSAYASDAWQIGSRVTLTLGLRFDRYRLFLPAQSHVARDAQVEQFAAVPNLAAWNTFTPRMSAVIDVSGSGTTLAKFSMGRYRGGANANLAFNSNPNSSPRWSQYEWLDPNGSGAWELGEEGRRQRRRGGIATESLGPALTLPVVDEAGAWIERTLSGVTLRSGVVWRLERFLFARQNDNQPFEAFTVPVAIRDRGPDGQEGTGDDGPVWTAYDLHPDFLGLPPVNVVRNVPGARNQYVTWEIVANRPMRGRWTFGAGYAHTWNGDQASGYAGQALRNNPLPLTPNDWLNAGDGGRYEFSTWTARAHATVEGPWQLQITPVLRHQSGQPYGRTQTTSVGQLNYGTVTLLMEPVGTRRQDNVTLVDVRIEKVIRLNQQRVALILDVFNSLNANPELSTIWASGTSFLRPLTVVSPRIARAGLRFDW
jgi:outer membrane receptor protein involved in Fe transport